MSVWRIKEKKLRVLNYESVNYVQPTGQTQKAACFCQYHHGLVRWVRQYLRLRSRSSSGVSATETTRSAELKLFFFFFTISPFKERSFAPVLNSIFFCFFGRKAGLKRFSEPYSLEFTKDFPMPASHKKNKTTHKVGFK